MKFAFGILLLAVAVNGISLASNNEADDIFWEYYKETHGKNYKPREDVIRRNIFLITKKMIEEQYEQFANGEHSFRTALNEFSDWLPYETAKLRGFKMSEVRPQSTHTFLAPDEDILIPKAIDWRLKGAVTPVKDQGGCGSCWAFSATGSVEGQHFRKTGKLVSLSEQNLMDCEKPDLSCDGGEMSNAFKYIKENGGIDTEKSYPYTEEDSPTCKFNTSNIGATIVGFVDIRKYDENALEKAVASIGPVSVGINAACGPFMSYSHGIYDNNVCDKNTLDHGVLVVGYGVNKKGIKYWIVKNSWGPNWGEHGYVRILKGKNIIGIATEALYPLV